MLFRSVVQREEPSLLPQLRPLLTQARNWLRPIARAFQGNSYKALTDLLARIEANVLRGIQVSQQATMLEGELHPPSDELRQLAAEAAARWKEISQEMLRQRRPKANREAAAANAKDTRTILTRLRRPGALFYFFQDTKGLGHHKELEDREPGLTALLEDFKIGRASCRERV